jgi:hypothetical protein
MPICLRSRTTKRGRKGTLKPGWKMTKAGKCVKSKRSYKKCKRKTVKWQGVPIVLPCRVSGLSPQLKARIDDMYDTARWRQCQQMNRGKTNKCRLIFFTPTTPTIRRSGPRFNLPKPKGRRCRWATTRGKHRAGQFKPC